MNRCAIEVMKDIKDIIMAYGESDEYRYFGFVYLKKTLD